MYNDPSGEFAFVPFILAIGKAVLIGAGVGLASYTIGLAIAGNLQKWNIGGALKATFWGAVSGAVSFGVGELFKAAAQTFGNALLQGVVHGVSQGVLGVVQGGDFLSSAISGFAGSLGSYGWGKAMKGLGYEQFAKSTGGIVAFGALSGGIGAELSGGNFWQGAVTGGIVAGLNHAMHREKTVAEPDPPVEDDFWTKLANVISGGAIDEARAILAFDATNPTTTERIIFNVGISLRNSTSETFLAGNLGAYGNYRGRGGGGIRVLSTTQRQLQAKFKHAIDFSITGHYNTTNMAKFKSAINTHINSPNIRVIRGTYHKQPAIHYVNPQTGLNVISKPNGQFWSGWKLSSGQLQNVLKHGNL